MKPAPRPLFKPKAEVRLSRGHFTHSVITDVEWKPEDGPRCVTKKRLAELRRDFNKHWASDDAP